MISLDMCKWNCSEYRVLPGFTYNTLLDFSAMVQTLRKWFLECLFGMEPWLCAFGHGRIVTTK